MSRAERVEIDQRKRRRETDFFVARKQKRGERVHIRHNGKRIDFVAREMDFFVAETAASDLP